jgi:hypothetical protein
MIIDVISDFFCKMRLFVGYFCLGRVRQNKVAYDHHIMFYFKSTDDLFVCLLASKIAERDTAFLNSVGLHKYSSLHINKDRTLL